MLDKSGGKDHIISSLRREGEKIGVNTLDTVFGQAVNLLEIVDDIPVQVKIKDGHIGDTMFVKPGSKYTWKSADINETLAPS